MRRLTDYLLAAALCLTLYVGVAALYTPTSTHPVLQHGPCFEAWGACRGE